MWLLFPFLQSFIAILTVLILTFFLLKRQDSKVWRHIKSGLSVVRHVPGLCRAGICGKVISMRRNKIDHLEDQDQVQLQVINRGNVLIQDEGHANLFGLIVFLISVLFVRLFWSCFYFVCLVFSVCACWFVCFSELACKNCDP